jgi:Rrf2 family protein
MVSRAADYALRATLVLAGLPPGARLCLSDLARRCDVPAPFLYKVLRPLTRHGLIVPYRGKTGGYELTAAGRDASVLDIVEAADGLPVLNACVITGGCHRAPECPAHPIWQQAQARVREVLGGARVADLARPDPSSDPAEARQATVFQVRRERRPAGGARPGSRSAEAGERAESTQRGW